MPRFYFDVHSSEGVHVDKTGVDFSDAVAAGSDAHKAALQLAAERLRNQKPPLQVTIVVRDEDGNAIESVKLPDD
jgi:hypothetical protein